MTPRISDRALHRLTIPELSGGVNYRDGISQVLDNQLTDCRNVWYKNGLLKTRPGVKCSKTDNFLSSPETEKPMDAKATVYTDPKNIRVIDGVTYQLVVFKYFNGIVLRYYADVDTFIEVAEINNFTSPSGYGAGDSGLPPNDDYTLNVFQHNTDIYIFTSAYDETNLIAPYFIYKVVEKEDKEERKFEAFRIGPKDVYVPLVMTGYTSIGYKDQSAEDTQKNATLYEGYNLLGNRYRFTGSLITENYVKPNGDPTKFVDTCMPMIYPFPKSLENLSGEVIVTVTLPNGLINMGDTQYRGESGTFTHRVYFDGRDECIEDGDQHTQKDKLRLHVAKDRFWFTHVDHEVVDHVDDTARIDPSNFMLENLEVEAPCQNSEENYKKVLNMTFNEWYGADSKGIYDGIHLFMGGHTSEKNLIIWSDFNKPLYFGENNYAYVGDKSQEVTAFGRQGESLIVFKERETYATQYISKDSVISAESIINNSVIDVTVAEVTFPMIQVHGFIGCDCPHSVQLCRNRLVWAHSDGKIYTLVSANQYNERSIFGVSGMIERRLSTYTSEELKNALSADWEGHYILSLGDKLYLMDYNSYGYANVASYAKNEDAQIRIPWWVWDKPKYNKNTYYDAYPTTDSYVESEECEINILSMITIGGRLYVMAMFEAHLAEGGSAYYPEIILFEGPDDMLPDIVLSQHGATQKKKREISVKEISAMAQTKLFDFGAATIQKSVPKAEISFGNNDGLPIMVTTITDRGENAREIALNFDDADDRNPQFFKNTVIRNEKRHVNRIGYKLESKGNLFVDALSVYYKQLGGSK